ncbi:MAG: hypothetical protein E7361_01690 [Clostridiales bacterium]|nr:hypothetical protein [Clostridiales bacterium]
MSCCKYSSEYISKNQTSIENVFINDFMLNAPENCVKVYLYGLYKCNNPESLDNNLSDISKALNYTEDDVISAFMYWEELNLVNIITKDPLEVRYLPIKNATSQLKKFNPDKYQSFNIKAQELLEKRMISPSEYQEYYYLIENKKIEPDALIMIIKYCVDMKGANIASSYILTVAKNWIFDGILTCDQVEERLMDLARNGEDISLVLKTLGIRRRASEEEYRLFLEWKNNLEMQQDIIVHLAKKAKAKGAGFNKLDALVGKCYTLKLNTTQEIDDYFNNLDSLYDLARTTCKGLGLRYDSVETVVDNYIAPWINLGFEPDAIIKLANYCFKFSIRTLEGMNGKMNQLFKLGLLTSDAIDEYLYDLAKDDESIQVILGKLALDRCVNSSDRNMYRVWLYTWGISEELIDFAIEKSVGMSMPMQYMNKLLSSFYSKKITTVEEAKSMLSDKKPYSNPKPTAEKAKGTEYSKTQLNSLINNLFEVEI